MNTPSLAEHRVELAVAVQTLEDPSWVGRLSNAVGKPVFVRAIMPKAVGKSVEKVTEAALRTALKAAFTTLPRKPLDRGPLVHKIVATKSGALGGSLGLLTLAVELPMSTLPILRAIGEIAQHEGEDLTRPEAALACIEVFALGGGSEDADSPADSGYFTVRSALSQSISEASTFVTEHGFVSQGAPVLVRLITDVSSYFGVVVSQKIGAQALPIIGVVGGAAVNAAFMDHYQDLAKAHFTVRRLEREFGHAPVRSLYEEVRRRGRMNEELKSR
jgi:hypothetical protein